MALTVRQALAYFDNKKSTLANFLGISRQAVSRWKLDNVLPQQYQALLASLSTDNNTVNQSINRIANSADNLCQSKKLNGVLYEIRGSILEAVSQMEKQGQHIVKLNIGNPAEFGFSAPDEIIRDVIHNIKIAEGYSDSRGLFSARKAVMQSCQSQKFPTVDINHIYMGNGVSELIILSLQGLLNDGDEVLLPSPNYPLWTAAVNLCGGRAVNYMCDEMAQWQPDIDDMRRKITANTRAIVIINPNNPTGAVYSKEHLLEIAELARRHNLVIFADEIYNQIVYDDARHIPIATLATDLLVVTFGGLSKNHRLAGFRSGWMIYSGERVRKAKDYLNGVDMLASLRLCPNVLGQLAVQTALGGTQSIDDLVKPTGRLYQQRDFIYNKLQEIPGISCVKPKGSLYIFPKLDRRFNIVDDEKMVLDLLREQHLLVVQGSGFHYPDHQHFRLVFLPQREILKNAMQRLTTFFKYYRQ